MSLVPPLDRSQAPKPGSKEENSILEQRLIFQESSVGKPSLTKITDKFRSYLTSKNKKDNDDDKRHYQYNYDDLLREVKLYELEMNKQSQQHESCLNIETKYYNELCNEINDNISSVEKELDELTVTLKNSKLIQKHRMLIEEYITTDIAILPSNNDIARNLHTIHNKMKSNEDSILSIDHKINTRKSQFQLLQQALNALMEPLPSEQQEQQQDEDNIID